MLAPLVFLFAILPKPANFECDLLLISTSKHTVEWDKNMSWLHSALEPRMGKVTLPAEREAEVVTARAAAADLNINKRPVLVMDGAAIKTNPYDPHRPKLLGVLAPLDPSQQVRSKQKMIGAYLQIQQGVDSYAAFSLGAKTQATGPRLRKNGAWPTFSLIPLREQLEKSRDVYFQEAIGEGLRNLALNVSLDSVSETAERIDKADSNYKQVCICAWGTQIPGRPQPDRIPTQRPRCPL